MESGAGLIKTELTALAMGNKGVLVQPIRPEASAYSSQGDAFSSAQSGALTSGQQCLEQSRGGRDGKVLAHIP